MHGPCVWAAFTTFSLLSIVYSLNLTLPTPHNIRGYLFYPDFGPYDYKSKKLKLTFDFDRIGIPYGSQSEIQCCGFKNSSTCAQSACNGHADWSETKTVTIKPYKRILFEAQPNIDYYLCRARIVSQNGSIRSHWSDYGCISLPYSYSTINPEPTLLICQALKYPPENYGKTALIRGIDIDGLNGPSEAYTIYFDQNCRLEYNGKGALASAEFYFCFDWIGNWQYRRNSTNHNCIFKLSTIYMGTYKEKHHHVACFDSPIDNIWCYGPRQLLFVTLLLATDQYRLIGYDLVSKTAFEIPENCNRSLSHRWITFDWRPYYAGDMDGEADVVFISDNELWSYHIQNESCTQIAALTDLGMAQTRNIAGQILQFDMDWSYFYWINSSTFSIHMYSWLEKDVRLLDKFQYYHSEMLEYKYNLTEPIIDRLDYTTAILAYSPALRPYPKMFECLIPDVDIYVVMSSDTSASVFIDKVYNDSEICKRTDKNSAYLNFDCELENGGDGGCHISEESYWGLLEKFTFQLTNLKKGSAYRVIVSSSLLGKEDLNKTFSMSFVAELPSTYAWWHYFLIVSSALLALIFTLIVFYFGWYKRHKALQDFLRRERIDATQLTLIQKLGEGEFGEVWLAGFSKETVMSAVAGSQPNLEVALKIRKLNTSFQSNLISADCFFQEAVTLNFLKHPNIILSHGICTNYKDLPPILVLEYMNGGNCVDYVTAERSHLTNPDLAHIIQDVLNACCHLATMRVVHKDIAARNVLIRKYPSGKPAVAKLTDFGLARDVSKKDFGYVSSPGSRTMFHYRSTAPEGFEGTFLFQSDVWSFGIFMWELYSLIQDDEPSPYFHLPDSTPEAILLFLKSGGRLGKPLAAPSDVHMLMRQCWAMEPLDRPSFRQLAASWRVLFQVNDQMPLHLLTHVESDQDQDHNYSGIQQNGRISVEETSPAKPPPYRDTDTSGTGYINWDKNDPCAPTEKHHRHTKLLFEQFGYKAAVLIDETSV